MPRRFPRQAWYELREGSTVISMCTASFEAVWERAVPHADYKL